MILYSKTITPLARSLNINVTMYVKIVNFKFTLYKQIF